MRRLTALAAAVTMLFPAGAYANVTDNDDMTVNISENTEIANAMMVVDVILPGFTYDGLLTADKSDYLNMLAYSEQVVTDEKGVLDVTFKLRANCPSGNYTFIISGKDYKREITAFVLNDELSRTAMEAIQDALASGESDENKINTIKSAIMSNPAEYGIDMTGYAGSFDDADWQKAAKLSYDHMKAEGITEVTTDSAPAIFNKGVAIVALENGLIDNIIKDARLFDLENGELAEWYKKDFVTDATGERMAQRLSGRNFDNFASFDEALTESYVLSVIENPDGSGNTKSVMQKFSGYIGTGSAGTDKRYAFVSNKVWNSYEDLKNAFDGYTEPVSPGGGGGGGGSGGGGGGGSGGTVKPDKNKITVPTVELPPVATIEPKITEKTVYPLTIFNDLDTVPWAEEAIIALTEQGILNGVGDNLFAPDRTITREEFTAMLVRAFLPDAEIKRIDFADISSDAWYYESVAKAYGAGIVNGETASVFGTGKNITRQDMAVMLHRAGEYIKLNIEAPEEYLKFEDDEFISDYATDAVYALREVKIINGVSDTEFAPVDNATRAQAAKMIYGLLEL